MKKGRKRRSEREKEGGRKGRREGKVFLGWRKVPSYLFSYM